MKKHIIAASLLIAGFLTGCQQEQSGAGDATVGFEKAEYTYKESTGLVKIPIKFTGEPVSYPIVVDASFTVEGEKTVEDVIIVTQSKGLKYLGDPDVPVYVEFKIRDNQEINEDVHMTLTLTEVKGAVAQNATASIVIADNDNNPYDRLWGEWIFKGYDVDGEENTFYVNVSGGFTEDEIENNSEKLLVCWGWAGQQHDLTGQGMTPDHQPVWYMEYDAETQSLAVQANTLMATAWEFSDVPGEYCDLYMLTVTPDWALSETTKLKGYWNDDMTVITFDGSYGLAARVIGIETQTNYGYWYGFQDITLSRKPSI